MNDRMIITEDGTFVSERVQITVEAIRNYDDRIDVEWVPPAARDAETAAFRLRYRPPQGEPYNMFTVRSEEEFDVRVLQKIIMNDQQVMGKQHISELEAFEEAKKRLVKQAWQDQIEEANDIAAHVLRSPKHKYKVSDDLIIKDYGNSRRPRPTNYAREDRPLFL